MVKQVYLTKVPLALFVLVLITATTGAATSATNSNTQLPDAYVLQSGKGFSGPTAIQDSIDSSSTLEYYKIYLEPGNYSQQLNVSKNIRIKGMGTNPEDTTIEVNTDGFVITVQDGITLTLENMAITNTGTGMALSETGVINLINCIITENYEEPIPQGMFEQNTSTSDTTEPPVIDSSTVVDSDVEVESADSNLSSTGNFTSPEIEETPLTNLEETSNTSISSNPVDDDSVEDVYSGFEVENVELIGSNVLSTENSTIEETVITEEETILTNTDEVNITFESSNPVVDDSVEIVDSDVSIESLDFSNSNISSSENPTTQLETEETTTTNTDEANSAPESSTPVDGGIPLTTMAYGMLMVVGGVVLPRKQN